MKHPTPRFESRKSFIRGKEFLDDPLTFSVEQSRRLGGLFSVPFYFKKIFVLTDLDAIRHVLIVNQKNYIKSPAYAQLKQALGNGLVTSEGAFWRRQRRLVQPVFYKNQMEGLFECMTEEAVKYFEEMSDRARGGAIVDVSQEMMNITANIVLKALFTSDNPASKKEMYESMEIAQEHIMYRTTRPYMIPFTYLNGRHRKFRKAVRLFDDHVYELIRARKKDPNPPPDLLTMLLMAKDEETGEQMNEKQLRDEAITLYAAGHETSANALAWTLFLLSKHPDIVEKMRSEADRVLGDRMPTFQDLSALTYIHQVIQEGMRLYPPAYAVGRQNVEPDEILGHPIPRKSILFMSIYAVHRDPKWWDNPDTFDPEHFAPEKVKARPRLAYMPFGAGPRMCVGNHFAMMEMQLILAMWVRMFDFDLVENHPVETHPLITLKPRYGIKLKVSQRKKILT
ncbi:MAG: cytochrome P450 [Bacteroidetes bacterium]|nr:MAG: cytochrome P450 [Bacteroidota bacterium]